MRTNLATFTRIAEYFSRAAIIGAMFIIFAMSHARAAELVMFEQAGCEWCETFNREIAPIYAKSEEGLRAPLRRVDIARASPPDLAFIQVERFTPLFVLVDKGREIGRIRGYPGPEGFWMQLSVLFGKLGAATMGGERAQLAGMQID
jgi:thioredoxin-related protein